MAEKTIALFPEAAFGPALNCVGIAQALREMGHKPVFICDRGFKGVFEKYGFPEYLVNMIFEGENCSHCNVANWARLRMLVSARRGRNRCKVSTNSDLFTLS